MKEEDVFQVVSDFYFTKYFIGSGKLFFASTGARIQSGNFQVIEYNSNSAMNPKFPVNRIEFLQGYKGELVTNK